MMILTSEKIVEAVKEYYNLKSIIDEAQKRLDQLKPDIIKAVSGQEKVGEFMVSVANVQQERLDSVKIKSDYPEIYNQFVKTIEFQVLRIKKV